MTCQFEEIENHISSLVLSSVETGPGLPFHKDSVLHGDIVVETDPLIKPNLSISPKVGNLFTANFPATKVRSTLKNDDGSSDPAIALW